MPYTAKQKNTVYNKPESNPIKLHYCFTGLYIEHLMFVKCMEDMVVLCYSHLYQGKQWLRDCDKKKKLIEAICNKPVVLLPL